MQAWTAKINLGLNVGKNKSRLKFYFFWLGHKLGPIPKRGPAGAGLGPGKKPGTLNGSGSGHGSCPAGWIQVWKNPARIQPVVIPTIARPNHKLCASNDPLQEVSPLYLGRSSSRGRNLDMRGSTLMPLGFKANLQIVNCIQWQYDHTKIIPKQQDLLTNATYKRYIS